ncbi:MAG: hypothetical protein ACO3K7_04740, partial [Candidatus Marinamargulisbacteria bacterium]
DIFNGKLIICLKKNNQFEYDGLFKNGHFQSGTASKFNDGVLIFQITGTFNGQNIKKGEIYTVSWKDCNYIYTGPIIYQKIKGEVDQVYPDTPGGQFKRENEDAQKISWTLSDMNFCINYYGIRSIQDVILRKTENVEWWIDENKNYTYSKSHIKSNDGNLYTLTKRCAKSQKILFTIEGRFYGDVVNKSQLYTLTYPEEGWSYRGGVSYKKIPDNIEPYPIESGISIKNNQSYFILPNSNDSLLGSVNFFEKNTQYPLTIQSQKNTGTIPLVTHRINFAEVNTDTCRIKSLHFSMYSIHGVFNGDKIYPNNTYVIRYKNGDLFSGTVSEDYEPLCGKFTGHYYSYHGSFLSQHQPEITEKIIFNRINILKKIIQNLKILTDILVSSTSSNILFSCDTEEDCRQAIIKIHTHWKNSLEICANSKIIFKDYLLIINAIKPLLDTMNCPNDIECMNILNICVKHIRSIHESLKVVS